jgi:hypothetical protein
MSKRDEQDDFLIYGESDYGEPRQDGRDGPEDDWAPPSWYDKKTGTWWWREEGKWRPDPCPVRPRGTALGMFYFVTAFGEVRAFSSSALHGAGGLPDLFMGEFWWPLRHFRKYDLEKGELVGRIQREKCLNFLIRDCKKAGLYDGSTVTRGVGTWSGPNDRPLFHSGTHIYHDGEIHLPGAEIGDALYVVGGKREPPAHESGGRFRSYRLLPAGESVGRTIAAHLNEWVWDSPEALDLFLGGLHCDMLCSALSWLPHKFVLAPYGSGKSSLLQYGRAVVGGSAHNVQTTYSKAYLEQKFGGSAAAFFLDETESSEEGDRIRKIFEFVRLLSDDTAEGGRGSSGGVTRKLDMHGTVTMAATVTEEWEPQDRSRITLLEIQPFSSRGPENPPSPPELLAANLKQAASLSPSLRARALEKWDLFQRNLKIARAAILEMGGEPRDADQLGHLIAGWKTITSDQELQTGEEVTRFRPFIMSLIESEEADDAPNDFLTTLFSTAPDMWRNGQHLSIGQIIAKGRSEAPEADDWRKVLPLYGMRLEKQKGEKWSDAWLWVATKNVELDRLFANQPKYRGKKRTQILRQLRRNDNGVITTATRSHKHARFGGAQSHYTMVPPCFLPSEADG